MKKLLKYLYLLSLICILIFSSSSVQQFGSFESGIYGEGSRQLPYRLLRPKQLEKGVDYPIVLFLHGAGERGTDNEKPLYHIAPLALNPTNRAKFPAYFLVPQCPKDKRWVEVDWSLSEHEQPKQPSWPLQMAFDLLDSLSETLQVDRSRIYLTGLSMGGFGTWDLIARDPDYFACAVPVCGGGDVATAQRIKDIPIWAFHGAKDRTVIPERSRDMINALIEAGGNPKYTEYINVYHTSWKPAYSDTALIHWIFDQKK